MRRFPAIFSTVVLGAWLAGCSDSDPQKGDTTSPDTDVSEVTPDVEPDTTPDVEPDTVPDVEPDTTPDVEPDVVPDVAPDTTPDVVPDTDDTGDAEDDTSDTLDDADGSTEPPVLTIAKGSRCNALVPFEAPALPFTDDGTTVGLTDDYIYTTGTACGGVGSALWGDASPDIVYTFTPAIDGVYNLTLQPGAGYDPALMVTDKCPPIGEDGFLGLTCHGVSDQGTEGSREFMRMPMVAGKTYYLLIDGWNNNIPVSGTYNLGIVLGEDCSDDLDNDLNGNTDCNDTQCANDPLCDESNFEGGCNNGDDDDGDGATDCADSDCVGTDACDEATYASGCTNDRDDDGDGATDCDDPDCSANAACNESTYTNGCINNTDDDGDGLTDCADPNCWSVAICNESTYAEGCTNELDDDDDGRTDCGDPDCGGAPTCIGSGETCSDPLVLAAGAPTAGTTVGRVNDYTTSASNCILESQSTSFGSATGEAVYSFTPTLTGLYDIYVTGSFDLGLTLTTDCNFAGGTCFASERGLLSDGERIVAQLTEGVTYFIIVDGWSNSSASNTGTFTITAKFAVAAEVETLCENRNDEDTDGDVDCADADCAFNLAACTEVGKCTDGIDNDADSLTDCSDPECRIDPVTCPRPVGDNCGRVAVVTTAAPAVLNTCGFDIDFELSGVTGCLGGSVNAPDAVASFTAPTAGAYWIESVATGSYDAVLNIVRSNTCPAAIGRCSHSRDTTSLTEAVAVTMAQGETIYIVLTGDGAASSYCGSTSLRASLLPAEICTNATDDDRDGQTDCNDSDCSNSRSCNEYANGDDACEDGLDNDNDGRTDCLDLDCRANVVLCPSPAGDNCFNPVVVETATWFQDFDTCTFANDFRFTGDAGCADTTSTHTAADVVVKFIVPEDGDYRFAFDSSIDGSTFDSVLNVVQADLCPTSPVAECIIGSDIGNPERGTVEDAVAGEVYWVFADGWSTACSNGRLSITKLADEICNDGVDNDGDTFTDCADTPSCGQSPFCNESLNGAAACSDTIDNDTDGFTDCFDRDCSTNAACPGGVPGGSCGNPFVVNTTAFTANVDTCGYNNDFVPATGSGCRGTSTNTAPDFVLDFEPPEPGTYRITFDTTRPGSFAWDSVINVVKNAECPASPVATCFAGVDAGNPERIDVVAVAGDYFHIIVDGWSSACGPGVISVVKLADEVCNDTVDNDGDGRADCADSQCFGVGSCPAAPSGENCSNPLALTVGPARTLNTCTFLPDFAVTLGGGCINTAAAPDMLLSFTAPTAGSYTFTTDADWIDYETATNYVRGATCPTSPVSTCAASSQSDIGDETQTNSVTLAAGETLWIILGTNYSTTECGVATMTVTGPN